MMSAVLGPALLPGRVRLLEWADEGADTDAEDAGRHRAKSVDDAAHLRISNLKLRQCLQLKAVFFG